MTLTSDRRVELLSATPLFADVDAAGMARIAERGDRGVVRRRPCHRPPGRHRDRVLRHRGGGGPGRPRRDGHRPASVPGEFFGELSVLDGRPRTAQVIADGPTTCLALASWDFEAVVAEEPSVALAVMRGLARRLRELTEGHRH